MSSIDDKWVVFVRTADRSGSLTALAETFSSRGVSFESFSTLDVFDDVGQISIGFGGSENIARNILRTLERLAVVHSATLTRADDPALSAVAVIRRPAEDRAADAPSRPDVDVHIGALGEIEEIVESARRSGHLVQAITVLPPE